MSDAAKSSSIGGKPLMFESAVDCPGCGGRDWWRYKLVLHAETQPVYAWAEVHPVKGADGEDEVATGGYFDVCATCGWLREKTQQSP